MRDARLDAETGSKLQAVAIESPASVKRPSQLLNPAAPPECETRRPPGTCVTINPRA